MSDSKAESNTHTPEVTATQGQAPAPETNKPQATARQVDGATETSNEKDSGVPKGAKVEFFKLRQAKREAETAKSALEVQNEELKKRLEALEANQSKPSTPNVAGSKPDPFNDPDGYAAWVRAQAVEEAKQAYQQEQAQQKLSADAVNAGNWLRSRSHVQQDPQFAQELAVKINTVYAQDAERNPTAAAKAAYLDLCEEKGVNPDLGRSRPDPNVTVAPRISSGGGGGGGEVSLEQLKSMSPAEQRDAIKSGRYKGKAILI